MSAKSISEALFSAGFDLFSIIDAESVVDSAIPADSNKVLLIGSAGRTLWEKMPNLYRAKNEPVDEYTIDAVTRILEQHLSNKRWRLLFPQPVGSSCAPNLQALGKMAGWHYPSPLGNGINDVVGLWFAYRAVVLADTDWPASAPLSAASPCISCADTPCIKICPSAALQVGQAPDLTRCAGYRVQPASDCAATCLARMSCPVAPQWQYSTEQMSYFYRHSLPALKRWVRMKNG